MDKKAISLQLDEIRESLANISYEISNYEEQPLFERIESEFSTHEFAYALFHHNNKMAEEVYLELEYWINRSEQK